MIERMSRWEVHTRCQIDDRGLQRFCKFDQKRDACGGASSTVDDNHWVLCRSQKPSHLSNSAGVALRWGWKRELRYSQVGVFFNRILLELSVGYQEHWHAGRGHRNLVSAHGRLGEVSERYWQVVPLGVITDHGCCVFDAVVPFHSWPSFCRIYCVTQNNVDRNTIAVSIEDRHGSVLQSNRAMSKD